METLATPGSSDLGEKCGGAERLCGHRNGEELWEGRMDERWTEGQDEKPAWRGSSVGAFSSLHFGVLFILFSGIRESASVPCLGIPADGELED
jgi:hypothetical protein